MRREAQDVLAGLLVTFAVGIPLYAIGLVLEWPHGVLGFASILPIAAGVLLFETVGARLFRR